MQIDIIAFPWEQYKGLFEQGKLNDDDFLDSPENEKLWDDAPSFSDKVGDSMIFYNGVYEDTAWFKYLKFSSKKPFITFTSALLNEEFETDLGEEGDIECIATVISPERIAKLVDAASKINIDEVRKAHSTVATEGVDMGYGEQEMVGTELETDEYISYIEALIKFVTEVNGQSRCLAIHMG